jgi:putative drug exporter of the RND superfamily
LKSIARFAIRQRVPILAVWLAAFLVALFLAGNARDNLHETNLQIPGTVSDRAAKLTQEQFGATISLAILLKGPPGQVAALESETAKLVMRLERLEGVEVLSPFTVGADRVLREPPGQALLTLQVQRSEEQISNETIPAVQRELDRVKPPIQTEVSGRAPLVRALNEASLDSLDKGERIAFPILIVLLLLVFRSPIAAVVPLLCGLFVTRIGMAVMGALNDSFALDALALNMLTMIGLALGVDYSLLIVSRFREELAGGATVEQAIEQAVARAGRTVLFAGAALSIGMLGALMIAPGALLESATFGVIIACLLAMLAAVLGIPAGLAVLGTGVNRWQLWSARRENPWVRLSERLSSKPGVAALLAIFPLLLLSTPALALDTGPPNVANLPPDNASRKSYEAFEQDRGAGWATPFEITFHTRGPITTEQRLRALKRFQLRIAREPGVQAVLGPASLLDRTAVLRSLTRQVATGGRQLSQLQLGLARLLLGTGRLSRGLQSGAGGANALVGGLGQAARGSGRLARGTSGAAPAAGRLSAGVSSTGKGAHKLRKASHRVKRGSTRLEDALETLETSLVDQNRHSETRLTDPLDRAQSRVQSALRNLGSTNPAVAADPAVSRAKQDILAALAELGPLRSNLADYATEFDTNSVASKEILRNFTRLVEALTRIASGSKELDSGIARTAAGAASPAAAAGRLSEGTAALDSGIDQLLGGSGGGARALAAGLDRAAAGSNRIGRGLQRLLDGVVAVRERTNAQLRALRRQGTDVRKAATSGYFVLAGIEGAQPGTQENAGFAINTSRGGNTAREIVVPRGGAFDQKTLALRPLLEHQADTTANQMGAQALVGGPAVLLDDFDNATSARFPLLVAVLVIVTFGVLLVLFRAPVLALCAVLLNLVTVGAAVGVLILGFQTDPPPLGGPGYLDAIALSGIFAIIFGLSIDYEVFLISRLVEGRALTGTTEGAIRYSLEKTATIITGAAAVMAFVFLAFAVSPVANTRQFGIGLTVAVVLDATVVRLILLPALIRLFGERTWAVPAWLDRVLPRFSSH